MRRGSLEFWPHRRAKRLLPRVRTFAVSPETKFPSLIAFKAGMTHVGMVDDSLSPSKGQEIIRPVTILVLPKIFIYGARLYKKSYLYTHSAGAVFDKSLSQKVGIKNPKNTNLEEAKKKASEYSDVTALAFADPSEIGVEIKKQIRFEMPVGGKTIEEKLTFLEKWMGKEIKTSDVVALGEFIDVIAVSKGKGWEGPVRRFGVARQYHKATGKRRHVGSLGAWHPPKVLFSVPQAGHYGFNYRTELNKRILKLGTPQDAASITPAGGFINFGIIKGDYIMIEGSIPGASKRILRIRRALRPKAKVIVPKITYVSLTSKQGA